VSYDLILVGGSGAQFGYALLECLGMGFVDLPNALYVVDADQGFFTRVLKPAHEQFAGRAVQIHQQLDDSDASAPKAPRLIHTPPYSHAAAQFTVAELTQTQPLSRYGQACFTADEVGHKIHEGLYGMAKLGGLIVAHQEAQRQLLQQTTDATFPTSLLQSLGNNPASRDTIFLAGSVAGGTGAGFMAPLLKSLRKDPRFAQRPIHVFTFLPWFSLPTAKSGIGPSTERMALNASQGIRYLRDVAQEFKGPRPAPTCVHIIGLPRNAKPPARSGDHAEGGMHQAQPGPLMYYAASLLTNGLRLFQGTAATLDTGVYTLVCNPSVGGVGVLRGRIHYQLPSLGLRDGREPVLPFESLQGLLGAILVALEPLTDRTRFENAFGRVLDNPAYLPEVVYQALKQGRNTTPARHAAGVRLVELLTETRRRLQTELTRLQELLAQIGGPQDQAQLPDVPDWSRDKLRDVLHLHKVLTRSARFGALLENAVAQERLEVAAEIVVRALLRGLALGNNGETVKKINEHVRPTAQSDVTLPQGLPGATPVQDTPFVPLSDTLVDQLAGALVGDQLPDSQCLPSLLGKARVARFVSERVPEGHAFPLNISLADSPQGRMVLLWLGLTTGQWSVCERVFLDTAQHQTLTNFERAVRLFELAPGLTPYCARWVSLVAARRAGEAITDADVVGCSSPQTGWFVSARVEEGEHANLQPFRALAESITAQNWWEPLRWTYRVWLADVAARHPNASEQEWFRLLRLFAGGPQPREPLTQERLFVETEAWYAIGPIALQVGRRGQFAELDQVWLPRVLVREERERLLCVLVGTAEQSRATSPSVVVQQRGRDLALTLRREGNEFPLLHLRNPATVGHNLRPEDQLAGGAYELTDWSGTAQSPVPLHWGTFRALFAARLRAEHTIAPELQQNLQWGTVSHFLTTQPDFAQGLGFVQDPGRVALLANLTPGPFAPGLVNLFNRHFSLW
jgi:hypothetical protein